MPTLPFEQMPVQNEMSPVDTLSGQFTERQQFYVDQYDKFKNTPMGDDDLISGITKIQANYDREKAQYNRRLNDLEVLQKFVSEGVITQEAGQEAMWRMILPKESAEALYPDPAKPGKTFSIPQIDNIQDFAYDFMLRAVTPERERPFWRDAPMIPGTKDDLESQYVAARRMARYDTFNSGMKQQFDQAWDITAKTFEEFENWDPEDPRIKSMRANGPLGDVLNRKITPLATGVLTDMRKNKPFDFSPAGKTIKLNKEAAKMILKQAGGDPVKARNIAKELGYEL